ncbi:RsmB/NOP family class I SAM-dependent RNA methyltransferase [uncultured Tateyamaria sp.]|uniref:RsmB/NOP family class I SAM-dependent RNA methyltransferase n=1 Tax=uncultured Tateyamaria sp. TaxID=455651 RepID=UPI0026118D09|nr:RsmB/NOP family class I SAM-dependent RNA methyltransferase [uncultured Tateyamaria sp.]
MTPGARVAAAIEILDAIVAGQPAEQTLTRWARGNRFAGSKDRAAIRDHVFDALRHWRSDALRGGGVTGRARMIGRMRAAGLHLDAVFDGVGHAPPPLSAAERAAGQAPETQGDQWDMPDWLVRTFEDSLGDSAEATAMALSERAPVTLRVNTARTDVAAARIALASDGVETAPNARAASALTVIEGPRRVRGARAFNEGLVELQDASGQAAIAQLTGQGRALDYCAGGGGKALALAAQGWTVSAHDINPSRMRDLPERAARGGHMIEVLAADAVGHSAPFDLVLCDAPCSGAGTWRRAPEAKWTLTPARLDDLVALQRSVLQSAAPLVARTGVLAYATCSILRDENEVQIDWFLAANPDWDVLSVTRWPVDDLGDGFFLAQLARR